MEKEVAVKNFSERLGLNSEDKALIWGIDWVLFKHRQRMMEVEEKYWELKEQSADVRMIFDILKQELTNKKVKQSAL